MNNEMEVSIKEAIVKNLPAQVANELQEFIAQAKADSVALQKLKIENDRTALRLTETLTKLRKQEELDDQAEMISVERKKLDKMELELLKQTVRNEVAVANASKDATLAVVDKFLRNTETRTNVFRTVSHPVAGVAPSPSNPYGTPGMVMQGNDSETTTVSQM